MNDQDQVLQSLLLREALQQITRLQSALAELLLKNERLRQQAGSEPNR